MKLLAAVLIVNLLLTIIFVIANRKKEHGNCFIFAAMFLLVPIFGLAVYVIPHTLFKIIHKRNLYDQDDLILFQQKEAYVLKPKLNEELNIVPLQEALAIGTADEKRNLLLGILKKDMMQNTMITQSALNDVDSETSHYAAAATMEVYRKMKLNVQELEVKLAKDPMNSAIERDLLDQTYKYVQSGVLSERDRLINVNKYMMLMKSMLQKNEDKVQLDDYIHQIDFLMETNHLYEAETLAKHVKEKHPSEAIYLKLLQIYYNVKNKKEFYRIFAELKDSNISLSSKGMETLRFWMLRSE